MQQVTQNKLSIFGANHVSGKQLINTVINIFPSKQMFAQGYIGYSNVTNVVNITEKKIES